MKNGTLIACMLVGIGSGFVLMVGFDRGGDSAERSSPGVTEASRTSGGDFKKTAGGFAGCGWSTLAGTGDAARASFDEATGGLSQKPALALSFYNPEHAPETILETVRARGYDGPILGETTHEGILTPDGYHASKTGVLGFLAVRNESMKVGVGGASFNDSPPEVAAKEALRLAYLNAGVEMTRKPEMIILCVTLPHEEAVLESLSEETGPDIPLVGGTAAGMVDALSRKKMSKWSIIANDDVYRSGVGMALFFADEPFAWSFGGGYRRTSKSGVVTKCEGRLILEIDGRPAADVYNEWMGGRVYEARDRGENVVNFCTLYPICTSSKGGKDRFVRAWPSDDPNAPGSLRTGSTVHVGEEVFLSEGNWNILLNHFGSVSKRATEAIDGYQAEAGLFIYCGGAMACIPDEGRHHMAELVKSSVGDLPWIGVFTWGEQGYIPEVGNRHSNLSAGTILFPSSLD